MNNKLELYDIYDAWFVPFWKTTWFSVVAAIVGGSLLVGLLWLLWQRFKPAQKTTPEQRAFASLATLEVPTSLTQESEKQFYFMLTSLIKTYLSQRYHVDVTSKTDDELLTYVRAHAFNGEVVRALQDILDGLLLVKFADQRAVQEKMVGDKQRAHDLILAVAAYHDQS